MIEVKIDSIIEAIKRIISVNYQLGISTRPLMLVLLLIHIHIHIHILGSRSHDVAAAVIVTTIEIILTVLNIVFTYLLITITVEATAVVSKAAIAAVCEVVSATSM